MNLTVPERVTAYNQAALSELRAAAGASGDNAALQVTSNDNIHGDDNAAGRPGEH